MASRGGLQVGSVAVGVVAGIAALIVLKNLLVLLVGIALGVLLVAYVSRRR